MPERERRLGITERMSGILVLVALAPLIVVALLVLRIQREGLAAVEHDLEIAIADDAGRSVEASLLDAERAMHRVARLLSSDSIHDEDLRLALARDAIGDAELVAWVSVFAKDGSYIGGIEKAGSPVVAAKDLGGRELGREEHPTWVLVQRGGEIAAEYVEPLLVDGNVTGYLLAAASMPRLDTILEDLSLARLGRPGRVWVVDAQRRVVAGAPKQHPRGAPLAAHDALLSRVSDTALFAKPLDVHTSFVGAGDMMMLGTLRTLPAQRWAVVVERPEAEAFTTLSDSRRAVLLSAGAVAIIAAILGAIIARRTTRPVAALVGLTRAYARREFTRPNPVRRGDELGELGDALAQMATDLDASEGEIRRRERVEASLARYLPTEVASAIAKTGGVKSDDVKLLASRRMRVTVLFADVASFTPFVERAQPEDVVALLSELFTLLSEIVFRHGGMVDKFMGDCVMAVFGVRTEGDEAGQSHHVEDALAAADEMQRFVDAACARWRSRYDAEVKLGIGVAVGEALVGNLGSERRMEFTAIGDIVNIAARLESIARPGQVLVTSEIAEVGSGHGFELASLGEHAVRGKTAPVEIFELVR